MLLQKWLTCDVITRRSRHKTSTLRYAGRKLSDVNMMMSKGSDSGSRLKDPPEVTALKARMVKMLEGNPDLGGRKTICQGREKQQWAVRWLSG